MDPVAEYLRRFGPGASSAPTDDPVAAYRQRYGGQTPTPEPEPEPERQGFFQRTLSTLRDSGSPMMAPGSSGAADLLRKYGPGIARGVGDTFRDDEQGERIRADMRNQSTSQGLQFSTVVGESLARGASSALDPSNVGPNTSRAGGLVGDLSEYGFEAPRFFGEPGAVRAPVIDKMQRGSDALGRRADAMAGFRKDVQDVYGDAQTTQGLVAGAGTRMGLEVAPYLAGGAFGARMAVSRLPQAVTAGQRFGAAFAGLAGGEAIPVGIDAVRGQFGPEEESMAAVAVEFLGDNTQEWLKNKGADRTAALAKRVYEAAEVAMQTPEGRRNFEMMTGIVPSLVLGGSIMAVPELFRGLRAVGSVSGLADDVGEGIRAGLTTERGVVPPASPDGPFRDVRNPNPFDIQPAAPGSGVRGSGFPAAQPSLTPPTQPVRGLGRPPRLDDTPRDFRQGLGPATRQERDAFDMSVGVEEARQAIDPNPPLVDDGIPLGEALLAARQARMTQPLVSSETPAGLVPREEALIPGRQDTTIRDFQNVQLPFGDPEAPNVPLRGDRLEGDAPERIEGRETTPQSVQRQLRGRQADEAERARLDAEEQEYLATRGEPVDVGLRDIANPDERPGGFRIDNRAKPGAASPTARRTLQGRGDVDGLGEPPQLRTEEPRLDDELRTSMAEPERVEAPPEPEEVRAGMTRAEMGEGAEADRMWARLGELDDAERTGRVPQGIDETEFDARALQEQRAAKAAEEARLAAADAEELGEASPGRTELSEQEAAGLEVKRSMSRSLEEGAVHTFRRSDGQTIQVFRDNDAGMYFHLDQDGRPVTSRTGAASTSVSADGFTLKEIEDAFRRMAPEEVARRGGWQDIQIKGGADPAPAAKPAAKSPDTGGRVTVNLTEKQWADVQTALGMDDIANETWSGIESLPLGRGKVEVTMTPQQRQFVEEELRLRGTDQFDLDDGAVGVSNRRMKTLADKVREQMGGAEAGLVGGIARTGAGAAIGAGADEENRIRGAVAGAAALGGGPAALRAARQLNRVGAAGPGAVRKSGSWRGGPQVTIETRPGDTGRGLLAGVEVQNANLAPAVEARLAGQIFESARQAAPELFDGVDIVPSRGMWEGQATPNISLRFPADAEPEQVRQVMAALSYAFDQEGGLALRMPRRGDPVMGASGTTGSTRAMHITGLDGRALTEAEIEQVSRIMADNGFMGLSEQGGYVTAANIRGWGGFDLAEFNARMARVAEQLPENIRLHTANLYTETLNGSADYLRVFARDPEATGRVADVIRAIAPHYGERASLLGGDAAGTVANFEARADALTRGAGELGERLTADPTPPRSAGVEGTPTALTELAPLIKAKDRAGLRVALGLPAKGSVNKSTAVRAISKWAQQRLGGAIDLIEDRATIARSIVAEVLDARGSRDSAENWYTRSIEEAFELIRESNPELVNSATKAQAMRAALAITSQSMAVEKNAAYAVDVIRHFNEHGVFPIKGWGTGSASMKANFEKMNHLFRELGEEDTFRFLDSRFTVKELEDLGFTVSGELKDTVLEGSAILGPKVGGGFYQNLGGNYDPTTFDMWFMRTIGRITGTLESVVRGEALMNGRYRMGDEIRAFMDAPGKNQGLGAAPRRGVRWGNWTEGKWLSDFQKDIRAADLLPPDQQLKAIDAAMDRASTAIMKDWERAYRGWSKSPKKGGLPLEDRPSTPELVKAAKSLKESRTITPKDIPGSGGERNAMRDIMDDVRQILKEEHDLDLDNASIQALIWYPEKELYNRLGVRGAGADQIAFDEGIAKTLGVSDDARARVAERLDAAERPERGNLPPREDASGVRRPPLDAGGRERVVGRLSGPGRYGGVQSAPEVGGALAGGTIGAATAEGEEDVGTRFLAGAAIGAGGVAAARRLKGPQGAAKAAPTPTPAPKAAPAPREPAVVRAGADSPFTIRHDDSPDLADTPKEATGTSRLGRGEIPHEDSGTPVAESVSGRFSDAEKRAQEMVDEWFNVGKYDLSPEQERIFRSEAARAILDDPDLMTKKVVPFTEVEARAQEIGVDPEKLRAASDKDRLSGPEMLAAMRVLATNAENISDLLEQRTTAAIRSPFDVMEIDRKIADATRINEQLLGRVAQERTTRGRELGQLRILAKRNLDLSAWLSEARRMAGERRLSHEEINRVEELVRLAKAGGEADTEKLVRHMGNLKTSTFGEKISAVWKAGLLSLVRTMIVNVSGNISHAALRSVDQPVAAGLDYLISTIANTQRTTDWNTSMVKASGAGAKSGVREFQTILGVDAGAAALGRGEGLGGAVTAWSKAIRNGDFSDFLTRYDVNRVVNIENPMLDTAVKLSFLLQSASDRPFRVFAYEGALTEMASLSARKQGLKPGTPEFNRVMKEAYDNPPDEMRLMAYNEAMEAVFAHDTSIGQMLNSAKSPFRRWQQSDNILTSTVGATADLFVPFTTVPSGVATEVTLHSPFGWWKALQQGLEMQRAMKAGDTFKTAAAQRALVKAGAKSITGTGMFAAGYLLYTNGVMTGRAPTTPGARTQFNEEGKMPFSVEAGGRNWSLPKALSPIGGALALGAIAAQLADTDDPAEWYQRAFATGTGVASLAIETTALSGLDEASRVAQDPRAAERKVANTLATIAIPQVIAGMARAVDPTIREAQGFQETLMTRIPGVSRRLEGRLDRFGREQSRGDRPIERVAQMTDPFYSRRDRTKDDPVLKRLGELGVTSFGARRGGPGDTREDVRALVEMEGPVLYRMLETFMGTDQFSNGVRRRVEEIARSRGLPEGLDVESVTRQIQRDMVESEISSLRSSAMREHRNRKLMGQR